MPPPVGAAPRYMLDTNTLLYAMRAAARGANTSLIARMEGRLAGELVLSAITLGEMEHGWRAGHGDRAAAAPFLAMVPVLPFDATAAAGFGTVMAGLGKPKRRTYDRLIAGHALALGLTVVTTNVQDFADVAGLAVEDWAVEGA